MTSCLCCLNVPWKLYSSRGISAWGDRMWMFAVGLFMVRYFQIKNLFCFTNSVNGGNSKFVYLLQVELSPGSLKWPAIYGLTQSLTVVFAGSVIGRWVDRTPRWNGLCQFNYNSDQPY